MLKKTRQTLNEEYLDIIFIISNLINIFKGQSIFKEVIVIEKEVLEKRIQTISKEYLGIILVINNLVNIF